MSLNIHSIIKYRLILLLSGSILLCNCAVTETPQSNTKWQQEQPLQALNAEGRISLKTQDTGQTAHFDWSIQNKVETFNINTPLGNTVGQLCKDTQGVLAIDQHGKTYQASTPEELSYNLLGYWLPIAQLSIWANGQWIKDTPHHIHQDGTLEQLGWKISRQINSQNRPYLLMLDNEKLNIRMLFSSYDQQISSESPSQCQARNQIAI